MFEEEKNEDIYGKINNDFDYLMFDLTDEPNNNSINIEAPFNSDTTAILKDYKNNNHYSCPKCLFFPFIQIINKNEIRYICKCTKREGKIIKIKDLIKEITNIEDKENKNLLKNKELKCNKHKHKFRYYCINCHINICRECCESHLKEKHDLIIFDFNNYDIRKKINKLSEYFNTQQNDDEQIIKRKPDNNENISDLLENSSIFKEELNSDRLKNDNKLKVKIEKNNPNVIIEENNPYYFYELFKIIYNDYLNYPNYSHFFNIENFFRFMEKEMNAKKNNEIKKNNELNNIFKKGKDMMTIVYKNDNKEIKLFGSKFIENNFLNVRLEINNNLCGIKEYYKFDNNIEEVEIKLYISENQKTIDLSFMFSNCANLKSIYGISKWETKIKSIDHMFYNCISLSSLPDISEWDVSELKGISLMFYNCYSLLEFPDLSKWIEKNKIIDYKKDNYLFIGFSLQNNFKKIKYINQKKEEETLKNENINNKKENIIELNENKIKELEEIINKKNFQFIALKQTVNNIFYNNKVINIKIKLGNNKNVFFEEFCFEGDKASIIRQKCNIKERFLTYNYKWINEDLSIKENEIIDFAVINVTNKIYNVFFITSRGKEFQLFLDQDCPVQMAIIIFMQTRKLDLNKINKISFLFDAFKLKIEDKTPIKQFFKNIVDPKIVIVDLNCLI